MFSYKFITTITSLINIALLAAFVIVVIPCSLLNLTHRQHYFLKCGIEYDL